MVICSVYDLIDRGRTGWEGSSKTIATNISLVKMPLTSNVLYKCLSMISNFMYPLWSSKHAEFRGQQSVMSYSINYLSTSYGVHEFS